MNKIRKRYFGDRAFYNMILTIALPILLQNGITSFVNLLDSFMVVRVGAESFAGVSVVNQLIFVYNISIFGALSAASIFGAQFYGKGNIDGVKHTFRFKLICCLIFTLAFSLAFYFFDGPLVDRFIHDNADSEADVVLTRIEALKYMKIIIISLLPSVITQFYSSTLRDTGRPLLPMYASTAAVFINLIFNILLIFGYLGFPRLGVEGAAIATVISRVIEMFIVVIYTHTHTDKCKFIVGAYKSLYIPGSLIKQIAIKGTPLMMNEILWAIGQTILFSCYSTRGVDALTALGITNNVANLFNIVFMAFGGSISIVIGQLLGAGKLDEAVETNRKMIFFSVISCAFTGGLMYALSPVLPLIVPGEANTARTIASQLIKVAACLMPIHSFVHASYFTLRTGGKTIITFLFDSCFVWVVTIPVATVLSRFTSLNIVWMYILCQGVDIIKCIIGYILVKKKVWVNNMVSEL